MVVVCQCALVKLSVGCCNLSSALSSFLTVLLFPLRVKREGGHDALSLREITAHF